jgi:hypothetical protein
MAPMAFEEFTKKTAQAAGTPYVTIQKRGVFALNHAAFAALGEPGAVTLLFDQERQLVGFRPAHPSNEHAYAVRPNSKGTTHLITGALFTTHYGIPTETARRWPARLIEDNVLAIDLNYPPSGGPALRQPTRPATSSDPAAPPRRRRRTTFVGPGSDSA